MADTTTTGFLSSRARTISATRVMASADSTEVPPNFMTIILLVRGTVHSPLLYQHLSDLHRIERRALQ
jgi:hypothetical protein